MTEIIETPLELALELSLESAGFPLGKREYFLDDVVKSYFQGSELRQYFKQEMGPEFADLIERAIREAKQRKDLDPHARLLSWGLGLFYRDTLLPDDDSLVKDEPVFSRISKCTEKRRIRVDYHCFLSMEDQLRTSKGRFEEYAPEVNSLIKDGKYYEALIITRGTGVEVPVLGESHEDIISMCISGGKEGVVEVGVEDKSYDNKYELSKQLLSFNGKKLEIGGLVQGVCNLMRDN
ncbi:MAG TPA: hypothetical protein VJH20_00510 [Candidatus Nanoarchaeia archaeon]|nr:hypothetical protein [Candidatus Nanoarchaeia archaeon]